MMGCFFRCFSYQNGRRTLSRRKLTFHDRGDVPERHGAVKIPPRVKHAEESADQAAAVDSTVDSNVLEERDRGGGVGKKVALEKDVEASKPWSPAGDTVRGAFGDAGKDEGKEVVNEMGSSPRERGSIPASTDSASREVSKSVGETSVEEESSDSLFSISIESRDNSYSAIIAEKEVSSPVPVENPVKRNGQSYSSGRINGDDDKCHVVVLNQLENLLLPRPAKGRPTSPSKNHHQAKENKENAGTPPEVIWKAGLKRPDYILKPSSPFDSPHLHDISVDASLSSWLVESDGTPKSQRSVGGSPRKSPLQMTSLA